MGPRHPTTCQIPNGHICTTMSSIRGMRGFLASSTGVTCAAALALPLAPPSPSRAKDAGPADC
ncbi:N-acetylmuramoyl-L-alanine amidase, partial [Streptomyces sp. ME02-6987-2C]|nr:N-acetylmuramoyl-L-alanine amidase [Streptomyces sp. ME02-6987-2C]